MKTRIICFIASLILTLTVSQMQAQQSGNVSYPELGIEFTIPQGWVGQLNGEAYFIGHQSTPGFIMLTTHEAKSVEEMRQNASQGMVDQTNGVNLQLSGQLENVGSQGVGAEFSGSLGGQQARAYMVGMINPYGAGVLVMSAVSQQQWSDQYKQLALQVANSLRFTQATQPPVVNEWKEKLGNTRLTYMDSYTSLDYSDANITTGGGYSSEVVIDLCTQGYFNYKSSSNISVTGGANTTYSGSASSHSQNKGNGTWELRADPSGNVYLILNFYGGEVYEYALTYPDNELHLNGKRYFHTWTGEYAPNCY